MNLSERLQNDPSFQPCAHKLLEAGFTTNYDDAVNFLIARRKLTIDADHRAAIWTKPAAICDSTCRGVIQ